MSGMTIEQLRKMVRAQPFRPFAIHLADGRQVEIKHPEFLATSPSGRTAIVFYTDDTFEAIDVLLVTSVSVLDGVKPRPRKPR